MSDAVKTAGVPEATVRTVIQRSAESWFQMTVVPSGAKGGQPHRYELTVRVTTKMSRDLLSLRGVLTLQPVLGLTNCVTPALDC
jgi:hypothetical protein